MFVHDFAFHLDPGMSIKRYLLRTNDEGSTRSAIAKQANESRRALQALHLFEICRARKIDGVARTLEKREPWFLRAHGTIPHATIQVAKIITRDGPLKGQQ
jgi:hypothetical protein